MKNFTPRSFGLFVTRATPVKGGTLLSTPFTLADGSVVTILARQRNGKTELTDWGMTADFLNRFNKRWEDIIERMALRHVVHGRVTVEGREIVSRVNGDAMPRHIGALVQTILTMNSSVLLAHDVEDTEFARKVDKAIRLQLGKTHEIVADWYDPGHDPHKAFVADYRVNGAAPPVHLFVVGSSTKISRVTASSLFFKSVGINAPSVVIINHALSLGSRQKERLQVAGDKLVWNIDRQATQLPKLIQFN